ncbi:MAG: hypothetical protein HGA66_12165 [Holophaga sp.]|nr:hypothetical protein [Holophaga sp.]
MARPSRWFFVLFCVFSLVGLSCGGSGGSGGGTPALNGPTNLQVTGDLGISSYLEFSWTAPANKIDGYEFEGALGSGTFTKVGTDLLPAAWTYASASFNLDVVPEDSELRFRMRAVLGTAVSPYSNVVASPTGLRKPVFTSTVNGADGIDLKWTNNSSVADTLTLERGTSTTWGGTYDWSVISGVSFGTTAYLDNQAPESTYLAYRVTYSKGAKAVQAISSTLSTSLKAPTSLVATPMVEGVSLNWVNRSSGATEVVVMRANGITSYLNYQEVAHLAPTATSYQDLMLATGFYTYRVEARKASSSVAPSLSVQVATLPTPGSLSLLAPAIKSMPASVMGALDSSGAWTFAQYKDYTTFEIATPSGTGWLSNPLANASLLVEPKLQLDSHDRPHTVYLRKVLQGSEEVAITHAWFDGAAWKTEEVARRILSGSSPSGGITFTLDQADGLHLAWHKGSYSASGLEYACKDPDGAWKIESLDLVAPAPTSLGSFRLTTDASGVPYVLLGTWQEIFLLQRQGPNQWQWEKVPTGTASTSSYDTMDFMVSYGGDLHVFFTRTHEPFDSVNYSDLCDIRKAGGAWTPIQVVTTTGFTGSTSVSYFARSLKSDRIAIRFMGTSGQQLLTLNQGTWSTFTLGPSDSNRPYLGFDKNDRFYLLQQIGYSSGTSLSTYVLYSEAP